MTNDRVAVVGVGNIGIEYGRVLKFLGVESLIIGRTKKRVEAAHKNHPELDFTSGGLGSWLQHNDCPKKAIIATQGEFLEPCIRTLLSAGCQSFLVEKPLSCFPSKVEALIKLADENKAQISVAFNRRNYTSIKKANEMITADGGLSSVKFDFTEAIARIDPSKYSKEFNVFWGIANSIHVIDTAFYLAGEPKMMECRQYGTAVAWHKAGSIFVGNGITKKEIPFSYHADWGSAGRWSIELQTQQRKLILSPIEKLKQQHNGSFEIEPIEIDDSHDHQFKPGFLSQVSDWLGNGTSLCYLEGLISLLRSAYQIFGYREKTCL